MAGVAMALLLAGPTVAQDDGLRAAIARDLPTLNALYRDLHAHPELSGQEVKTAARLAVEVRRLGFVVTEKVGRTGVVAVMANGPGPVMMIRADMDGLPVTEATGLSYASKVRATTDEGIESGVMHACGHDLHMAAWVGAARRLAALKDRWSGTLVMVLQPAEERGWGAKWMLDDGLFTRFPRPTHAIAFHDNADLPAGRIGIAPGYVFANVDSVDITVRGVGGHGAYPHKVKDPIVLGARIVTALQTLVSREANPLEPAVVTVGSFRSGSKHNIVPDEATLLLTVRSTSPGSRRALLEGIARIARGEAIAAGLPEDRMPVIAVKDEFTPAAWNTPEFAGELKAVFTARFGAEQVIVQPPTMGGEDFGRYVIADPRIKSTIFWVGAVPRARWEAAQRPGAAPLPSLHSATWAPDAETTIATAAEALSAAALAVLTPSDRQ